MLIILLNCLARLFSDLTRVDLPDQYFLAGYPGFLEVSLLVVPKVG